MHILILQFCDCIRFHLLVSKVKVLWGLHSRSADMHDIQLRDYKLYKVGASYYIHGLLLLMDCFLVKFQLYWYDTLSYNHLLS